MYGNVANPREKSQRGGREEEEGDMASTGEGVKKRSGFGYKDEIGLGLLRGGFG